MSFALVPGTPPEDALCLQDAPVASHVTLSEASSFDTAVAAACLALCAGRPDLVAHALVSPCHGEPLAPLGKVFGDEAINHGELASALFRLGATGTPLTAAALRTGAAVWTATIPRLGWNGLGRVLRDHGIKSGGAFPVILDNRVGAVIELLSFDHLQCDLASEALARELSVGLAQHAVPVPHLDLLD